MKRLFTSALLIGMLNIASLVSAEHEPSDPYEAMCQSTGRFRAVNYAPKDFQQHDNTYYQLQFYGHCGEQPNLLEIDKVTVVGKNAPAAAANGTWASTSPETAANGAKTPYEIHKVEIWLSPKQKGDAPYWRLAFSKTYITNKAGEVLSTKKGPSKDEENFLTISSQSIMDMVITPYLSAKKGGPIFPSALGPIQCDKGEVEDAPILERAYLDYMKK